MDLVDKLLINVPKDDEGYEDIERFWSATDKLSFPFSVRFKSKLYTSVKSPSKKVSDSKPLLKIVELLNFKENADYDTSSSISVYDESDDEDLTEPENDQIFQKETSTVIYKEQSIDSRKSRSAIQSLQRSSNYGTRPSNGSDRLSYDFSDSFPDGHTPDKYKDSFTPEANFELQSPEFLPQTEEKRSFLLSSIKKDYRNNSADRRRVSFDIEPPYNDDHLASPADFSSEQFNSDSTSNFHQLTDEMEIENSVSKLHGSFKKSSSPRNSSGLLSILSTPNSTEFVRGRRISDSTFNEQDTLPDDTDSEDVDTSHNSRIAASSENADISSSFIDSSFIHTISSSNKKYKLGKKKLAKRNIQDTETNSSEEDDSIDEELNGLRRSRRATKGKRFAFWKGERPQYQEGTLVGLIAAEPTPIKRGSKVKSKTRKNLPHSNALRSRQDHIDEDSIELPSNVTFLDPALSESLKIWDEYYERPTTAQVICYSSNLPEPKVLPKTAQRPIGRNKVGVASHYFNIAEVQGSMSGWIAGSVELPPEAIKDAEGVGKYAQVFFISEGQSQSLEFGLADPSNDVWSESSAQRVLLGPGDSFYVPPGNIYRLENHSRNSSCKLYYLIIKPIEEPDKFVGSSVSNNTIKSGVSY